MRQVLVGALVVALARTLGAGSASNLDKPIKGELRISSSFFSRPCIFGGAVDDLGRKARVLVGFESTHDCGPSPWLARTPSLIGTGGDSVDLTGLSLRQAFDHLIMVMPTDSWKEMG